MKKSFIILLHAGFWSCYFLLIFIMLAVTYRSGIQVNNQEFRIMKVLKILFFFAFIPSFISYITYYLLLFPRFLAQKKFFLTFIFGILVSTASALAGFMLLRHFMEVGHILDRYPAVGSPASSAVIAIIAMTCIGIVCGIVALVIKGFVTWVNEIKWKESLNEKTHEMEMELVRLQLDPHLLFNTINNIDALILKDAVAASGFLNKLSDVMRFILYEAKADKILLSKEIEYIDKYIALQKIRTANENYIQFSVTGTIGNKVIAPMVFIPFIENAFKHAANKKVEHAINVRINVTDDTIHLLCENKMDSTLTGRYPDGGLGNELIEKRLELLYAGRHTLSVHKTNELYCVSLTIPNG